MRCSLPCTGFLAHTQLDKLRTIIESMLASSSTLLSMSMAPEKTLMTLTPGQIDPQATCPACSLDVSHQVSTLVQRYEQLQDMVNNLAASRPSKKSKLQSQVIPAGRAPAAAAHGPLGRATAWRPAEGGVAVESPGAWYLSLRASFPWVEPVSDPAKVLCPSIGSQQGTPTEGPWARAGSRGWGNTAG